MTKILNLPREDVLKELQQGRVTVCIVGLGYVGLPLAALFASQGARVIGCDVRKEVVEAVSQGRSIIKEHDVMELLKSHAKPLQVLCPSCAVQIFKVDEDTFCPHCQRLVEVNGQGVRLLSQVINKEDLSANKPQALESLLTTAVKNGNLIATSDTPRAVREADAVLITVGTPLDNQKRPDTSALSEACSQIGRGLTKNTLVVLKSTVSPGTTRHFVAPLLTKASGLTPGVDFGLAHMPERIKEGMALYEFRMLPRIVAGIDEKSTQAAAALFSIFPAPIYTFNSPEVTETSKLFENIYRDVNIALANELAQACEAIGVDVTNVLEAAHTDPKTHFLIPGPGVGGYCLPKDAYYLIQPAADLGFTPRLIPLARKVNDDMPLHAVRLIEEALNEAGVNISESKIAILGLAFKGNSGDLRNTPVLTIVKMLEERNAHITGYDPLVDPSEAKCLFDKSQLTLNLIDAIADADCIVITADHAEFRRLKISELLLAARNLKALVDTRHVFNPEDLNSSSLVYRGLGRGQMKTATDQSVSAPHHTSIEDELILKVANHPTD